MEPSSLDMLSAGGLNSLTFSEPYAKLCFVNSLIQSMSRQQPEYNERKILYIDTDTMFTAYLKAGFLAFSFSGNKEEGFHFPPSITRMNNTSDVKNHRKIDIFLPSEGRFEALLADVIGAMPQASIVIFDSLTSLYNMYFPARDNPNRNRIDEEEVESQSHRKQYNQRSTKVIKKE